MFDLRKGIEKVLAPKAKLYPVHCNRISQLDDPCLRKLYYARAAWNKKLPPNLTLQGVFETGNKLERVITNIISEVGDACEPKFRIVGTQLPTKDSLLKQYQIFGTIDGLLQIKTDDWWKTMGVIDIKTSSPNIYRFLNNYEDLGKYSWTRKYRGQLQLYSLAHNLENCYILFVNKSNLYEMKLIEFPVDMGYCEGLLQKAEIVNKAIAGEAPVPEGINDPDICPDCDFLAHCKPDYSTGGNIKLNDNPELIAILDRMDELVEGKKEYASLEKQRDLLLTKGQDIVCGDWMVLWKKSEMHYKAQPAKEARITEAWRKKIVKREKKP